MSHGGREVESCEDAVCEELMLELAAAIAAVEARADVNRTTAGKGMPGSNLRWPVRAPAGKAN